MFRPIPDLNLQSVKMPDALLASQNVLINQNVLIKSKAI